MYTRHGHQIEGTPYIPKDMGMQVARCGGPGLCPQCSQDAARATKDVPRPNPVEEVSDVPILHAGFSELKPDGESAYDFQLKAKINLVEFYNAKVAADMTPITTDDVFVVWFAKTLQNWKCCLGTTRQDNMYFEITYNGDEKELYLDAYTKFANIRVPDGIYQK